MPLGEAVGKHKGPHRTRPSLGRPCRSAAGAAGSFAVGVPSLPSRLHAGSDRGHFVLFLFYFLLLLPLSRPDCPPNPPPPVPVV